VLQLNRKNLTLYVLSENMVDISTLHHARNLKGYPMVFNWGGILREVFF